MVLNTHDTDCYVDGIGVRVLKMLGNHPDYVRDAAALKRAKSNARVVPGRDGQRKRIARKNLVIVTMSGMLSGGPAMTYVPEIRDDPTNKICLIGYQVKGASDRELVERSRCELNDDVVLVAARAEIYDSSAHVDRHGPLSFLDDYRDAPVSVNHGDRRAAFAGELSADGYETTAPEIGATAEVWDTPVVTRSGSNRPLPRPTRHVRRRPELLPTGPQRHTRIRGVGPAATGTGR